MAFGRTLDAVDSKAIHEALRDATVTSIRFIDTGEHSYDHTQAEFTRTDGTEYVLSRRHKRFREVFEIVNELDLPWTYHDTFFVDLLMPREWDVEAEAEVTARATVTAYTEDEARAAFSEKPVSALDLAWDFASFRISNAKASED